MCRTWARWYAAEHYKANKAAYTEKSRRWRELNQEASTEMSRRYYRKYPERARAASLRCYHKNPQKHADYARNAYRRNPGPGKALSAARRARILNATPPWANLEAIRDFYELCPPGYHVDHIHPLKGKTVCGLHVWENLQYLPAKENMSKGNRFYG